MSTKQPPQSLEAERSVLGGLMLDMDALDEVANIMEARDFYKPLHQTIYTAIGEVAKKGQPIDLVNVSDHLMSKNELDYIGGPSYLSEIIEDTPSAAHIISYANIVKSKSLIRNVIQASGEIIDKGYKQDFESVQSYLDEAEAKMFAIAEQKQTNQLVEASEIIKASLEKLEELYENKSDVIGVPSGFIELDNMTAGFQSGEITIIAARPSMGKTAFSLNLTLNAALSDNKHIAYFSLEMAKEQLMIRLLSQESGISLSQLRVGDIKENQWPKLVSSAAKLSEAPIFIDDTSGISPYEIRSKCRRLKAQKGLDLILIDYLQLMSLNQKVESREREVSEISKMLKAISKELKVPVIALAQLNRSVEGRTDRRPMLSDLRESGSIEQDADIIMMLFREEYYDRDNPDLKGVAEVIVGKQRNGPTGTVRLKWIPEFGTFANPDDVQNGPRPPMPNAPPPGMDSTFVPQSASEINAPSANAPKNFAPGS